MCSARISALSASAGRTALHIGRLGRHLTVAKSSKSLHITALTVTYRSCIVNRVAFGKSACDLNVAAVVQRKLQELFGLFDLLARQDLDDGHLDLAEIVEADGRQRLGQRVGGRSLRRDVQEIGRASCRERV